MNRVIRTYRAGHSRPVIDVPASEITWRANCRTLAAEANEEGLFYYPVDWPLISLICREAGLEGGLS